MKKILAMITVMFGVSMFAYAKMNNEQVVADNTMPNQTAPSEQATQPGYGTQSPSQQTTRPMPDQTQPGPAHPEGSTETDQGTDMTTDPTDDDTMDGSGDDDDDDSEDTYHSAQ